MQILQKAMLKKKKEEKKTLLAARRYRGFAFLKIFKEYSRELLILLLILDIKFIEGIKSVIRSTL